MSYLKNGRILPANGISNYSAEVGIPPDEWPLFISFVKKGVIAYATDYTGDVWVVFNTNAAKLDGISNVLYLLVVSYTNIIYINRDGKVVTAGLSVGQNIGERTFSYYDSKITVHDYLEDIVTISNTHALDKHGVLYILADNRYTYCREYINCLSIARPFAAIDMDGNFIHGDRLQLQDEKVINLYWWIALCASGYVYINIGDNKNRFRILIDNPEDVKFITMVYVNRILVLYNNGKLLEYVKSAYDCKIRSSVVDEDVDALPGQSVGRKKNTKSARNVA